MIAPRDPDTIPAALPMTLRYDEHYHEDVTLDDGTPVRLRLVRPDDKAMLLAGWARLSPASRYRRFMSAKTQLSERDLRYLTEMDNLNHLAIGAESTARGAKEGVAVARFIRLAARPEVAEAAIAVADDFQGKGLGRLLLARLVLAARERGIQRFTCDVMADNAPMRALLHHLADHAVEHTTAGISSLELSLGDELVSPPAVVDRDSSIYRLLGLAAKGAVKLARSLEGLLTDEP